jgi:sugar O-acyltransferase (sialic acid O-acetyltransferase NeuD family)
MLIIGAKGFAKELLEAICQTNANDESIAFFDDVSEDLPDLLFGKYAIIRDLEEAEKYLKTDEGKFALGVGNPVLRYKLSEKFKKSGELISIISPFARIGRWKNHIGEGTNVLSNAVIESNNEIGVGCLIHVGALISHDVTIGKFCEISPSANLLGAVSVGDFCSIGAGAQILPKIKVGRNVVIGAGAVVTKDVSDNSLVVGVPAKIVKKLEPIDF